MAFTTINDPSKHFQTMLYTGNNDVQAVTNDGNSDLQPDWVWLKNRDDARWHLLNDSSRGVSYNVYSNEDDAEDIGGSGGNTSITAFNSDGFTLASDASSGGWNENGDAHVAWQWKANGGTTTAGGDDDTIATSTHQANTTAGFSIVTYTGEQANKTVKHGLNQALDVLLVKNRDTAKDWRMWFKGFSGTERLEFNNTEAKSTTNTSWNGTVPGSSVFSLGDDSNTNTNGDKFIAYCFHAVQGYSKFGTYKANGNADGTFIYTGFKPRWVMIKKINAAESWFIVDSKRETTNPTGVKFLRADTNNDEPSSDKYLDLLSNGFKSRDVTGYHNDGGDLYIYWAFAEHPFVSSTGTPVSAK